LNTVHLIQRSANPELAIDGVLLTMYDARLNLFAPGGAEAREYFRNQVFETVVPRKRTFSGGAELWEGDHLI